MYAVVDLASDISPGDIIPDYSKTVMKVYIDIAKLKTLSGHELDFLGILEPRHIHRGDSSYLTPDWLFLNLSCSLKRFLFLSMSLHSSLVLLH